MKHPNKVLIRQFLLAVRAKGMIKAAAIPPMGGSPVVNAFTMPEQVDEASIWIEQQSTQGMNCFFELNPPLRKEDCRSKEEDIMEAQFIAVDIDPDGDLDYEDARKRLLDSVLPALKSYSIKPSFIIDSGNGLQALYRLEKPSTDFERVKELARRMAQQFKGDSTFSVEHLFRVPGTLNYPTKTKLKRGYPEEPSLASTILLDGKSHSLNALDAALPALISTPGATYGNGEFKEDESSLSQEEKDRLMAKFDEILGTNHSLSARWEGDTEGLNDTSRSGIDMSLATLLKKEGFSYREVRDLVIQCRHGAGKDKFESGDERYFQRLWTRSSIKTPQEVICELEGITDVDDMIPLIASASLSHSSEAQVIDHLIKKRLPGVTKRALQKDLKAYKEQQEEDEHSEAIFYEPHRLPEVVDEVDEKLSTLDPPVMFVRGGDLCQIEKHAPCTVDGIRNKEEYYKISSVNTIRAVDVITQKIPIVKKVQNSVKSIACPRDVANTLLSRAGNWKQKPLSAIIHTPTLRPDSNILSTPGFDESTGLFLIDSDLCHINVPEIPTKADAEAALEILQEPISEFPFEDNLSKFVMIAAILTVLLRPILRAAPMFLINATKMATGKSLLINVITMIADGRTSPAMMSYTDNDEELRKRILAQLIAGANITCIDNVSIPIENDTLCTILTEPVFSDRILGKSENSSVPTSTTWFATGNAIRVRGDLSTRTLLCNLDAKTEHPEEREFNRDLYQWVPAHRKQLVEAALTILRAYQVEAETNPIEMTAWGRYDQWSNMVRAPLIWLGMEDPYLSTKSIQAYDPVREELGEVLEAWHGVYGDTPVLSKDVILDIKDPIMGVNAIENKNKQRLGEALEIVAPVLSTRKLSGYIRKHKGRIENRYVIKEGPKVENTVQWIVEKVA